MLTVFPFTHSFSLVFVSMFHIRKTSGFLSLYCTVSFLSVVFFFFPSQIEGLQTHLGLLFYFLNFEKFCCSALAAAVLG